MNILSSTVTWFGVSGVITEVIFALVTLFIAIYAYKVYKISKHRPTALFGLAFLSIGFAYFIQALLNFLILQRVSTNDILSPIFGQAVSSSLQLSNLATIFHIIFMILGLTLLAYVTLKERGTKIFLLVLSLSFAGLLLTTNLGALFYLLSSIFLLFITAQHVQRHVKNPSRNCLFVFLGFGMLFLGTVQLAFATTMSLLYVSGHIVLLLGYLLLLVNLLRVVKL